MPGSPDSQLVSCTESVVRETLDTHVAGAFEIIEPGAAPRVSLRRSPQRSAEDAFC